MYQIITSVPIVWFFIIIPFLFGKPIWGIDSGISFVWVGVLFLFGILLQESNFLENISKKIKVFLSFIFILILPFLLKFFIISQPATNFQNKLYANYSMPIFILSVLIFGIFIESNLKLKIPFKNNPSINWFILTSYFITQVPVINYQLTTNFHLNYNFSSKKWLLALLLLSFSILAITVLTTLFISWISRISFFSRIITRTTIKDINSLSNSPQILTKILKENWRTILIAVLGYIISYIQILVITLLYTPFKVSIFKNIIKLSSQQLLLNTIIVYVLFIFIYGIINRYWYSLTIILGFSSIVTVAEFLKIRLRQEPILPSDLAMLTAVDDLLKMVNPFTIFIVLIAILILAITGFILQHHFDSMYHINSLKKRMLMVILPIIFFSGSFFVYHFKSLPNIIMVGFNVKFSTIDQGREARNNGPMIQFIQSMDTTIMEKPNGYSKTKINEIMRKYNHKAITINKTRKNKLTNQTFMFVLSESFSNPNRVPNLKVSPNPIPYLLSLKNNYNSGLMLSTGYGGGTANMEWQSLTGLSISNLSSTLATPYTQLVPQQDISPNFTNLFSESEAIHPYNASLYNRINVFKKFGFDKFFYQGSSHKLSYQNKIEKSPYISDTSAYEQALKTIKAKDSGSQFIQLSTMQNHMPYNNYYNNSKRYNVTGKAISKKQKQSVQTYSKGLNYTDKSLEKLIAKLDKIKHPVTMVWYGDHLAALYDKDSMKKYGIKLHETDYFIYSNKTHKATKVNKYVSPYSFSALALESSNTKVTPYYALITTVTDDLPAMTIDPSQSQTNSVNGANIFISQSGKKVKSSSLTKKQKQTLQDYRLIQYDLTAGKQYSSHWAQKQIK
ncbi:LTA synthase family protein [Paucilactobacillus kaifaensis]|uniref:LTA synthase family protein n=1 Tax=Paucilactobacillus kaifaensis TaxID=2559921 RepID=UPI0010F47378|nr:alkaline phosphatase family protein [Paucilactobacillus kaifaensis]